MCENIKQIGNESSINEKFDQIIQAIQLDIDTRLERMETSLAIILKKTKG